ncbi:MAG TPA: HDIG domain-containing protein [Herpetosiphon sp.]|uniref:Metal dependent phosphohydrolase n=1 Tax=Herpetosiphon aurantiacus (strain ATCC 23779 / DSM 785 / 114-95) TaxID=316274 RepID=A9B2L7_HERA2|nr:HDIG domain-containing metalloprotein [Herpetosiphon sp.]ABX05468.1 metal dependent phosphohydrolase [Herpetosiphon aurantiacus DSM 785]HBW52850.1 HDIG domain-containing protein [Herpetosiphon sp.]
MVNSYAAAEALLAEWVQSESLRKHCLAVSTSMRHMAQRQQVDAELWATVGLIHDLDYERFPNAAQSPTAEHPSEAVRVLRELGWSEEICRAILSHADYCHVERITPMEKTLYAVDELSGFVTAVALVRPDKSVHSVEVSSVKKKMKDKAFARAVNREDIIRGAQELDVPLETLIEEVITALRGNAVALGLNGV